MRLDQAIADVDAALRQAEDSLRLNPRISEGLLSRLVLRTGLDTLEICVVVVRVLARSLTDLAKRRGRTSGCSRRMWRWRWRSCSPTSAARW